MAPGTTAAAVAPQPRGPIAAAVARCGSGSPPARPHAWVVEALHRGNRAHCGVATNRQSIGKMILCIIIYRLPPLPPTSQKVGWG